MPIALTRPTRPTSGVLSLMTKVVGSGAEKPLIVLALPAV
jgi:hypothetical protein